MSSKFFVYREETTLGDTEATGSVFQKVGELTSGDFSAVEKFILITEG